jgi:eukaryotic-like serine/threonine-protein kinase
MLPTPADPESSAGDATRFNLPPAVSPRTDSDASRFGPPPEADSDLTNFGTPPPTGSDLREDGTVPPPRGRHIGPYELLQVLGRGGMGVVYKARDNTLHRFVAIKVLRNRDADPEETLRFRQEAAAMARVQHPGVVQVFEVGEHEGMAYLVMEYCPGGGLDRYLSGTPLPPKEAVALVEHLAQAVQAAVLPIDGGGGLV